MKLEQAKNAKLNTRLEKQEAKLSRLQEKMLKVKKFAKEQKKQLEYSKIEHQVYLAHMHGKINDFRKKNSKQKQILMRTMNVKLCYEKVIQDALADKQLKYKIQALIQRG